MGTVREDYSNDGDAWNYFSRDQARSRVYRRGEDGLAVKGSNSRRTVVRPYQQRRQPRQDVKEYYFYLDRTPTHSCVKCLYFHGDNGASHQTGWTGIIAPRIQAYGYLTAADVLSGASHIGYKSNAILPFAER